MKLRTSRLPYPPAALILVILCFASSGCDLNGPLDESDLSLRSLEGNYDVQRFDHKTVAVRIRAVFLNKSQQSVYLSANDGNVLYSFQRMNGEKWEYIQTGQTGLACGGCSKPVIVAPGEALEFEWNIGSSFATTLAGDRWGTEDVSGTYRAGLSVYLQYDASPQALVRDLSGILSGRVSGNASFTPSFQLIEVAADERRF